MSADNKCAAYGAGGTPCSQKQVQGINTLLKEIAEQPCVICEMRAHAAVAAFLALRMTAVLQAFDRFQEQQRQQRAPDNQPGGAA